MTDECFICARERAVDPRRLGAAAHVRGALHQRGREPGVWGGVFMCTVLYSVHYCSCKLDYTSTSTCARADVDVGHTVQLHYSRRVSV